MYKIQCKKVSIEMENHVLYGVSDDSGFYFDFTADIRQAERMVDFLNENDVEPCHVPEIIEDLFYSCGQNSGVYFSKTEQ